MSGKNSKPPDRVTFFHFIIPPSEWGKERKNGRPWSDRLTPVLIEGWQRACARLDIDPNMEEFVENITENYIGVVLRREITGEEMKDTIEMVLLYEIDSYVGSNDIDLVIKLAVGSIKNMGKWYGQVDEMAQDIGCTRIVLDGRVGWGKHIEKIGYTESSRIFRKRISSWREPRREPTQED